MAPIFVFHVGSAPHRDDFRPVSYSGVLRCWASSLGISPPKRIGCLTPRFSKLLQRRTMAKHCREGFDVDIEILHTFFQPLTSNDIGLISNQIPSSREANESGRVVG